MAQSMIIEALDKFYPTNKQVYRLYLKAICSENDLIGTMKQIPAHIDMSSLPQIDGDKRTVVISISSYNEDEAKKNFNIFVQYLLKEKISYTLEDR
jgi:hypothetical protein